MRLQRKKEDQLQRELEQKAEREKQRARDEAEVRVVTCAASLST